MKVSQYQGHRRSYQQMLFPGHFLNTSPHEQWSDDNGHPFSKTLDRTQQIALGLGMAFTIRQKPSNWSADGRYFWNW